MQKSSVMLTVYFEDPFWIGIIEREAGGQYSACKVTFGAEPKDYEVEEYLISNWFKLRFEPSIISEKKEAKHINPKRMQRSINKTLASHGAGTKAQQAIKLQYEQGKEEHKKISRMQREAEKKRQFDIHLEKKKKKHKGH